MGQLKSEILRNNKKYWSTKFKNSPNPRNMTDRQNTWCRVFPEKLTVVKLLKKIRCLQGLCKLTIVFTNILHWFLLRIARIHSTHYFFTISFNIMLPSRREVLSIAVFCRNVFLMKMSSLKSCTLLERKTKHFIPSCDWLNVILTSHFRMEIALGLFSSLSFATDWVLFCLLVHKYRLTCIMRHLMFS